MSPRLRALWRRLTRRSPSPRIHLAAHIRPDGVAVAPCYRGDRAISRRAWTLDAEGVTCRRCRVALIARGEAAHGDVMLVRLNRPVRKGEIVTLSDIVREPSEGAP